MPVPIKEQSASQLKRDGSVWKALYITPGQGSSGKYSESMLAEHAPKAFPVGTKHWFKHPETPDQQRDPRDQWGVTVEAGEYIPGVGYEGRIQVLDHWKPVVESLAKAGQASLSIWASGEIDDDGNVLSLLEDTQNSVDLVAYPGRPGSGLTEQMFESARNGASGPTETPGVTSAQVEERKRMEEEVKALKGAVEALASALTSFITEQKTAAEAARQAEADAQAGQKSVEEAAEAAVAEYDGKIKAIELAGELLPSQVESLREAAKRGEDVAPLIESAKKFADEAKATFQASESKSYVVGGSAKTAEDLIPKGW